MAVLLPTQNLSIKNSASSLTFQNSPKLQIQRTDTSVPFKIDVTQNLKFAKNALNVIEKYQESIRTKAKENALLSAQNDASVEFNNLLRDYKNLKGQNAVDALPEYQKKLENLKKNYSDAFKGYGDVAHSFNKWFDDKSNSFGIELKNYNDAQIEAVNDAEMKGRISNSANTLTEHWGSPLEDKYYQEYVSATNAVLEKNGYVTGGEEWQAEQRKMADEVTKIAVGNQILNKNFGGAIASLKRWRPRISADAYNDLLAKAIKGAEDEQERQERKALLREQRQTNLELKREREALRAIQPLNAVEQLRFKEAHKDSTFEKMKELFMIKNNKKEDDLSSADYNDIQIMVDGDLSRQVIEENARRKAVSDTDSILDNNLSSILYAKQTNGELKYKNRDDLYLNIDDLNLRSSLIVQYGDKEKLNTKLAMLYDNMNNKANYRLSSFISTASDDVLDLFYGTPERQKETELTYGTIPLNDQKAQARILKIQQQHQGTSIKKGDALSSRVLDELNIKSNDLFKGDNSSKFMFIMPVAQDLFTSYVNSNLIKKDQNGAGVPGISSLNPKEISNAIEFVIRSPEFEQAKQDFKNSKDVIDDTYDDLDDSDLLNDTFSKDEVKSQLWQYQSQYYRDNGTYPTSRQLYLDFVNKQKSKLSDRERMVK